MKNSDQYPNADRQIMLRDTAQQHLPSTEVRELVPDYEDEIDLRDLLDVLVSVVDVGAGRGHFSQLLCDRLRESGLAPDTRVLLGLLIAEGLQLVEVTPGALGAQLARVGSAALCPCEILVLLFGAGVGRLVEPRLPKRNRAGVDGIRLDRGHHGHDGRVSVGG